jgi:isochorismate hydrolase
MKEEYLTAATFRQETDALLQAVRSSGLRRSVPFVPDRAALLVIDMQRYFLDPDAPAFVPAAPAIVPSVQSLINNFRRALRPVVFTRHIDDTMSDNSLSRWWKRKLTEDNPLCYLIADLLLKNDSVLVKSEYDAFHNSRLQDLLASEGTTQVVICGVMTNLCCETTARSAFVRGYDVFFPVDTTATVSRELHRSSLLNLAHGFATVCTAEEILSQLPAYYET